MILETVWRGRQVSPNSVAVVVADLRRALGDDARDPAYIETVAKRGYRLKGNPPPAYSNAADDIRALPRRRLTYLVAAIGLVGVVTASASWMGHARADLRITIEPVRNDTGAESYGPLADAMSELLVNRISTFTAVKIYRQVGMERIDARTQGLVVQSKLILWNGIPTLSMTSEDGRGHVVWTGMVMGPPDTLAKKTIAELAGLRNALRTPATTRTEEGG